MTLLSNRVFSEIQLGDSAESVHILVKKDIEFFARSSGDFNPYHLDDAFAKNAMFHGIVAHGLWTASRISAVLGTQLPGPGTIYLAQTLRFMRPVMLADTITAKVTVIKKFVRKPILLLSCQCTNQKNKIVLLGVAKVLAPTEKIHCESIMLPED